MTTSDLPEVSNLLKKLLIRHWIKCAQNVARQFASVHPSEVFHYVQCRLKFFGTA